MELQVILITESVSLSIMVKLMNCFLVNAATGRLKDIPEGAVCMTVCVCVM